MNPRGSRQLLIAEFLKAAMMRLHDCADYLRICAHFGIMNAKQEKKLALVSCISQNFLVSDVFM